ncbi:hypothetical protein KIPB_007791 [Kipferlia bialata]|uniref:Uncharacterized protein n=1 Tax=Kipferlia bialata TaxID=797122 RepID=A0A9K3D1G0_9EUKA|nr:hypothetical protein KIPB_007791 [Kipferlia bialata]|eukprot:g7791.t1
MSCEEEFSFQDTDQDMGDSGECSLASESNSPSPVVKVRPRKKRHTHVKISIGGDQPTGEAPQGSSGPSVSAIPLDALETDGCVETCSAGSPTGGWGDYLPNVGAPLPASPDTLHTHGEAEEGVLVEAQCREVGDIPCPTPLLSESDSADHDGHDEEGVSGMHAPTNDGVDGVEVSGDFDSDTGGSDSDSARLPGPPPPMSDESPVPVPPDQATPPLSPSQAVPILTPVLEPEAAKEAQEAQQCKDVAPPPLTVSASPKSRTPRRIPKPPVSYLGDSYCIPHNRKAERALIRPFDVKGGSVDVSVEYLCAQCVEERGAEASVPEDQAGVYAALSRGMVCVSAVPSELGRLSVAGVKAWVVAQATHSQQSLEDMFLSVEDTFDHYLTAKAGVGRKAGQIKRMLKSDSFTSLQASLKMLRDIQALQSYMPDRVMLPYPSVPVSCNQGAGVPDSEDDPESGMERVSFWQGLLSEASPSALGKGLSAVATLVERAEEVGGGRGDVARGHLQAVRDSGLIMRTLYSCNGQCLKSSRAAIRGVLAILEVEVPNALGEGVVPPPSLPPALSLQCCGLSHVLLGIVTQQTDTSLPTALGYPLDAEVVRYTSIVTDCIGAVPPCPARTACVHHVARSPLLKHLLDMVGRGPGVDAEGAGDALHRLCVCISECGTPASVLEWVQRVDTVSHHLRTLFPGPDTGMDVDMEGRGDEAGEDSGGGFDGAPDALESQRLKQIEDQRIEAEENERLARVARESEEERERRELKDALRRVERLKRQEARYASTSLSTEERPPLTDSGQGAETEGAGDTGLVNRCIHVDEASLPSGHHVPTGGASLGQNRGTGGKGSSGTGRGGTGTDGRGVEGSDTDIEFEDAEAGSGTVGQGATRRLGHGTLSPQHTHTHTYTKERPETGAGGTGRHGAASAISRGREREREKDLERVKSDGLPKHLLSAAADLGKRALKFAQRGLSTDLDPTTCLTQPRTSLDTSREIGGERGGGKRRRGDVHSKPRREGREKDGEGMGRPKAVVRDKARQDRHKILPTDNGGSFMHRMDCLFEMDGSVAGCAGGEGAPRQQRGRRPVPGGVCIMSDTDTDLDLDIDIASDGEGGSGSVGRARVPRRLKGGESDDNYEPSQPAEYLGDIEAPAKRRPRPKRTYGHSAVDSIAHDSHTERDRDTDTSRGVERKQQKGRRLQDRPSTGHAAREGVDRDRHGQRQRGVTDVDSRKGHEYDWTGEMYRKGTESSVSSARQAAGTKGTRERERGSDRRGGVGLVRRDMETHRVPKTRPIQGNSNLPAFQTALARSKAESHQSDLSPLASHEMSIDAMHSILRQEGRERGREGDMHGRGQGTHMETPHQGAGRESDAQEEEVVDLSFD